MGMFIFLLILLLLWQGTYFLGVDVFHAFHSYAVPSPIGVAGRFMELCVNGSLPSAVLHSLGRGAVGFVLAAFIGIVIAKIYSIDIGCPRHVYTEEFVGLRHQILEEVRGGAV